MDALGRVVRPGLDGASMTPLARCVIISTTLPGHCCPLAVSDRDLGGGPPLSIPWELLRQ
ncbi:hypothetical protein [Nocardia sp. NBC_01377]|uniref:hypothetical protein n=1 Tax=Nocardia sp. NBC_01377 TaxID=2903595 RepID=UPI00386642C9